MNIGVQKIGSKWLNGTQTSGVSVLHDEHVERLSLQSVVLIKYRLFYDAEYIIVVVLGVNL